MEPPTEAPIEPQEFARRILRQHGEMGPRRWLDDPDTAALVALAAMATRWNLSGPEFEAKLERLCRTPTGAARPAAARLLQLWREQRDGSVEPGPVEPLGGPPQAPVEPRRPIPLRPEPVRSEPRRPEPTPLRPWPLEAEPPSTEQRAASTDRLKILIVEDDAMIQDLMQEILQDEYELLVATTGQEALDLARAELPAAITLDLMLPDGHGGRVLSELKADPATARIPVIVTSAYTGGLAIKHRALAARVLFKPFGPIELLDALRAVVPAD